MGSWRDVAAAVSRQEPRAPQGEYGLPDELVRQLRHLDQLPPPPKLHAPANWRPVVNDALRLAREGWAATALDMGWSTYDLFGIGPKDDWEFSGLAVWLAGRPILRLDASAACASERRDFGSIFIRGGMGHGTHPTVTPVHLWDFGR